MRLTLPTKESYLVRIESIQTFKTTSLSKSWISVTTDGSRFAVADEKGATQLFAIDNVEPIREFILKRFVLVLQCTGDSAVIADRGDKQYWRQIQLWDLGER